MYLHLGQNTVIKLNEIIGIFDLETSTISKTTRNYLANAQKAGRVINVSMEMPKSFVLCCGKNGKIIVYITQISSSTLLKRTSYMDDIANV
jgi:extracellular matrix regulatory protein B